MSAHSKSTTTIISSRQLRKHFVLAAPDFKVTDLNGGISKISFAAETTHWECQLANTVEGVGLDTSTADADNEMNSEVLFIL